ncbi:hypothetical protein DCS_01350 [Drechmeria coniospora]|uniref:GTP-binding protein SAR1 n=1 Tax=Drechmeria coniospora TaxID=98403 RepID=A0A151GT19_DRECN|nr:hypothetical protein DCS_01350 [Drechmeria coniospora]KYK60213.1 hypothetical protein DCS_01350 [Drechmeria coniospora]
MTPLPMTVPAPACAFANEAEDVDEPPEPQLHQPTPSKFQRTTIRPSNGQSSLLTRAIMGLSDDENECAGVPTDSQRRRSMASNVSVASTADLTSDTGLTSPCRTNTPSPPIPELMGLALGSDLTDHTIQETSKNAPRKRCIQFACDAKPVTPLQQAALRPAPMVKAPSAQEAPRRTCIKFVAPPRPASTQNTPPNRTRGSTVVFAPAGNTESPSTPKKLGFPTGANPACPLLPAQRPAVTGRPRFLRASSKDIVNDGSQFHEFASGTAREEDWIRQPNPVLAAKLTINDTLTKENHIRRLAVEVEEEAEQEEEEAALDDDDDEDDDDDDDDDNTNDFDADEEDDDGADQNDDEDGSDGYYTDEETGFADSDDDDDDENENMVFWTPSQNIAIRPRPAMVRAQSSSLTEPQSEDSLVAGASGSVGRLKMKRFKPQSETPDLPDSTDFVCGTLDEDRPLEEAYLSCLAARRTGKLRIIPQDIDPSFPASDPDNDDDDVYNPVGHGSDDGDAWVPGVMEDLHHGQDRSRRRRQSEHLASPRPHRFQAPVRILSPPPKARGRSPKNRVGRHSPRRRTKSPAPKAKKTPTGSPAPAGRVQFRLTGRPNTTRTKSLPRPAALCPNMRKSIKYLHDNDIHMRGAIDIVKGLERKRQRRKEKFFQKYCNRARRGQIPERKPLPGRGAERMKELGLLMAGKRDQGNYVLSV